MILFRATRMCRSTVIGGHAMWGSMERRPDILEWSNANRLLLNEMGQLRWAETRGFIYYSGVAASWVAEKLSRQAKTKEVSADDNNKATSGGAAAVDSVSTSSVVNTEKETPSSTIREDDTSSSSNHTGMEQYHQSRELCNTFKWKRVTWDQGADFDAFSQRTMDAHALGFFASIPAMSHLCIHLVVDPVAASRMARSRSAGFLSWSSAPTDYRAIQSGTLTAWALHEGAAFLVRPGGSTATSDAATSPVQRDSTIARAAPHLNRVAPFTVLWERGEVHMLDSASPSDLVTFLELYAERLQRIQSDHADEQESIAEMVEQVRFRCSLVAVRFNGDTQATSRAEMSPAWMAMCGKENYVSPDEVIMFCKGMLATAWLFRRIFKGHVVRILPAGRSFALDMKQREVHIPCDFSRYNYHRWHRTYLRHEAIGNMYRNYWFIWLLLACGIIGDLDVI